MFFQCAPKPIKAFLPKKRLLKYCASLKNFRNMNINASQRGRNTHTHTLTLRHTLTYNKGNLLITKHKIGWYFLAAGQKRSQPQEKEKEEGRERESSPGVWYICRCSLILGLSFCMLINYFQDFHSDMWKFKNSIWQLFHVIEPQLWRRKRGERWSLHLKE